MENCLLRSSRVTVNAATLGFAFIEASSFFHAAIAATLRAIVHLDGAWFARFCGPVLALTHWGKSLRVIVHSAAGQTSSGTLAQR